MDNDDQSASVFSHRIKLYQSICRGELSDQILDALLPDGKPMEYERQLWDYKLELPYLPKGIKPSDDKKNAFNGDLAEVMKDAAAFFNSYGGYIIVGVRNLPREVIGFHGDFDCDELNKRLLASTGKSIECFYKTFIRKGGDGQSHPIGLLYIPQRTDETTPAQFNKDAPEKASAKRAYGRNDIYFRTGDQCIRAETSDHFAFLFTPGRRVLEEQHVPTSPVLDSNLGPRDPAFVEFVGRDAYLALLWKWFLDRFNPVKLLAGIGGVGKTALAREFSEMVASAAPFGFQKIVWLSAKKQYYTAISGRFVPASRIDFSTVDELLREICFELGMMETDIPEDISRESLMDQVVTALTVMPALVVVDDLDSLEPEQQQDVFHTLIAVFGRTSGKSPVGSRALLTARLDLGAAPGQVIRIKGLEFDEFVDFVEITCEALEIPLPADKASRRMERFHRVTEGSPTFTSSVLRLIVLGETLDHALLKWERSDGEEVRRFAFQRELDQLPDSATNALFALCILSESTLVELTQILSRSAQQVRDDFAELRKYHLIAHVEANLPGGTRISVPGSIRMMKEILSEKVRDPKRVETACVKARTASSRVRGDFGAHVNRIVALWSNSQPNDALDLADMLARQYPSDPDVKCLLGRAYLRLVIPDYRQAELSFRKAQELGCKRQELIPLWVEAKTALRDGTGLLEITKFTDKSVPPQDILLSRIGAYKNLAEMSLRVGNTRSAAERFLEGGLEIDKLFRLKKAFGWVPELKQSRKEFLISYFQLTDKDTSDPDEYIDVWLAAVRCFDSYVRPPIVMRIGANRLTGWWQAVERRPSASHRSADTLDVQMAKFQNILLTMRTQENPDEQFIFELENVHNDLAKRLEEYKNTI